MKVIETSVLCCLWLGTENNDLVSYVLTWYEGIAIPQAVGDSAVVTGLDHGVDHVRQECLLKGCK